MNPPGVDLLDAFGGSLGVVRDAVDVCLASKKFPYRFSITHGNRISDQQYPGQIGVILNKTEDVLPAILLRNPDIPGGLTRRNQFNPIPLRFR